MKKFAIALLLLSVATPAMAHHRAPRLRSGNFEVEPSHCTYDRLFGTVGTHQFLGEGIITITVNTSDLISITNTEHRVISTRKTVGVSNLEHNLKQVWRSS